MAATPKLGKSGLEPHTPLSPEPSSDSYHSLPGHLSRDLGQEPFFFLTPYWTKFIKKGGKTYAGGFVIQYMENCLSQNLPVIFGNRLFPPTFRTRGADELTIGTQGAVLQDEGHEEPCKFDRRRHWLRCRRG